MSVTVTWYGHACFQFQVDGTRLLVDPFLTGNPQAAIAPDEVAADVILVSHGHGDHVGDTVEIAKRTGAMVIANFEIQNWLSAQGIEHTHPMHIGGGRNFDWGRVKLTMAQHGSMLPDGIYGGNPCGFLFYLAGKKIYHACDTGLFYDMKLIGDEGVDLAILPIGDNFTMGPADALRAVELIRPDQVVPIHYDTFEVIEQDPYAWAGQVKEQTGVAVQVMTPGEAITL
jgi:L-ascorbate metabolism protein UlaG (beta-lactamase superfamily)